MEKLLIFLREVRAELSKVSWPTRNQTIAYTLVVIGLSLFVALYLGALDFLFELALNKFLLK